MNANATPEEAYRAGYLRFHAERGEGVGAAERRAALLEKAAVPGAGQLLTALTNLGILGGVAAPAALGAAGAYPLGRLAGRGLSDPPEDDELRQAELAAAYRRAAARLRANAAAARVAGRQRSPYGL